MIRADANIIKVKQLQNHSSTVIVDARTPREHMQAKIPGSILDNWEEGLDHKGKMMKSKDALERDFEEKRAKTRRSYAIVTRSRASHKYLQFKQAGYNNAKLYDGSIIDWAQRRNPIR
jgi:thiosulfate/3-mercaptopyruvate sulfurtransferase